MIKIILFIFILFNFYSNSHASIKEDIISLFILVGIIIERYLMNFELTFAAKS